MSTIEEIRRARSRSDVVRLDGMRAWARARAEGLQQTLP